MTAYVFKKPVVATTVGCIPEYVNNGITGLLVPPKDEEALANAIIKILSDDNLRKEMGENIEKMVDEEYSWENLAAKTNETYEQTIVHFQSKNE